MGLRGLSVLELLVLLAVLALLLSLGYGSFASSYRLRAATAQVVTLLAGARTEAVRRNVGVALELTEGGKGIRAWADRNGDGLKDDGEPTALSASLEAYGAGAELVGGSPRFNALGRPREPFALRVSVGGRSALLCVGKAGKIVEAKDACP